jgi:hypothetical protein
MSPDMDDTEYTVTLIYAPFLQPDGTLEWKTAYFEIRHSVVGEHITDAVYDNGAWWHLVLHRDSPPAGPDARADRVQVTEQMLRLMAPDACVDFLLTQIAL